MGQAPDLAMRFDLRVPPFARTTFAAQYGACLDMAVWAERYGFASINLSEHHGDEAGFTPAPLTIAAAVLARTNRINVQVAALLVPLHDPVRLAEQIATIDCLAPGRLSIVVGAGYRKIEFAMAGVERSERGRMVEECVAFWQKAWRGLPFEWRGREMMVTPPPASPGGPLIMMGGKSQIAARRAARMGLSFFPANGETALRDAYLDECAKVGFDGHIAGPAGQPTQPGFVTVSEDPEATWAEISRSVMYDAATYASWQDDPVHSSWMVEDTTDLAAVRRSGNYVVVTPDECLDLVRANGALMLHPLMGGIAPDRAWESLRLIEAKVLPRL